MERVYENDQISFTRDGAEMARIRETVKDDLVEVSLSGAFNSDLANDLFDELIALISVGKGIELNLGEVTHLSPSINRALLTVENKLEAVGKTMRMVHVPDSIYKGFRKNGMHELFEMELEK